MCPILFYCVYTTVKILQYTSSKAGLTSISQEARQSKRYKQENHELTVGCRCEIVCYVPSQQCHSFTLDQLKQVLAWLGDSVGVGQMLTEGFWESLDHF